MGHLKKYLAWILAALCALMPVAGLAAENRDTQLTTTLPREHTITVVCGAGGAVRVERARLSWIACPPLHWRLCRMRDTNSVRWRRSPAVA